MTDKDSNEEVFFECRICGSNKYNEITESNGVLGPGHNSWVVAYECNGCSVLFKDLEKFSVKKKKD